MAQDTPLDRPEVQEDVKSGALFERLRQHQARAIVPTRSPHVPRLCQLRSFSVFCTAGISYPRDLLTAPTPPNQSKQRLIGCAWTLPPAQAEAAMQRKGMLGGCCKAFSSHWEMLRGGAGR